MYQYLIALAPALLLTACSANGPSFSSAHQLAGNDTGVYVYRIKHMIPGGGADISIDGKSLGTLRDSGFLYTRLTPGTHTMTIPYRHAMFETKTLRYSFNVRKNEIKYIKIEYEPTGTTFRTSTASLPDMNWSFHAVPASVGQNQIRTLNLSN